jgi:hypothetical protein
MRSQLGLPDPPLLARTHDELAHHGMGNQDQGVTEPVVHDSTSTMDLLQLSNVGPTQRPQRMILDDLSTPMNLKAYGPWGWPYDDPECRGP